MTEQIEGQKEGIVEIPNTRKKMFKNLDSALDFVKWTRPEQVLLTQGVSPEGTHVCVVEYMEGR